MFTTGFKKMAGGRGKTIQKAFGYTAKASIPKNLGSAVATVTAVPLIATQKAAKRVAKRLERNRKEFAEGFRSRAGLGAHKKKAQKKEGPSFAQRHPLVTGGAGLLLGKMIFSNPEPQTDSTVIYPQ